MHNMCTLVYDFEQPFSQSNNKLDHDRLNCLWRSYQIIRSVLQLSGSKCSIYNIILLKMMLDTLAIPTSFILIMPLLVSATYIFLYKVCFFYGVIVVTLFGLVRNMCCLFTNSFPLLSLFTASQLQLCLHAVGFRNKANICYSHFSVINSHMEQHIAKHIMFYMNVNIYQKFVYPPDPLLE